MKKIRSFLDSIFNKAFYCYKNEKLSAAKEILKETERLWFNDKKSYKFMTLLAVIYVRFNELVVAERVLLEALALAPGNLKILYLLGEIYLKQKRYKEAEKIYKKAKREDSFNFDITLKLAKIAMLLNDYDRMISILQEGYSSDFIGEKEENKLKNFLLDFLRNIDYKNCFYILKEFRIWWKKEKEFKRRMANLIKNGRELNEK